MKKFLLLVIGIILMPSCVFASDNSVYIGCEGNKYKTNDEIKCNIYVDVDFIVTSVSGKILLDDDLELVSSSYDNDNWLMLDENFSVESINLISENKKERDKFIIASFVIKAINKEDISASKISFDDVVLSDENYEEHEIVADSFDLNLEYKSNNNIFVVLLFAFLVMVVIYLVNKEDNKNKKNKVGIIILVLFLFLIPDCVLASNDINISCDKTKLNSNEETSCSLSVSNLDFVPTDVAGTVKVGNYLSIVSSSYDRSNWTSFDSNFSVSDINLLRQSKDKVSSLTIATFKVKASSGAVGSSTISFNNIVMGDDNYNSVSLGNKSINVSFNSSNNYLNSLIVSEGNVDFSKDKTNYSFTMDSDSIVISATAADSKAKISGTGKINLLYGENIINVVVTAEDGSKKTYTLRITRKDNRSTNNYLKSLSLSCGNLNFNKNINNYNIEVDGDISKVIITASLEDSKAKFVNSFGPRSVNLNYGTNKVLIKVLSENEIEKVYTLNITRKDNRSSDTSLKSITISSGKINFNKDKLSYNVNVNNNIKKIKITAEANNSKSLVEIEGSQQLEVGENIFIIKVIAENGNIQEYKIVVNREKKITITDNNKLTNIEIKNHEINFSSNLYEYTVKTKNSKLDIIVTLASEESTYVINGNDNLEDGSIISIVVTDKDDNHNIYKIYIEKIHEINIYLILFIISLVLNILLILVIIYLLIKRNKKNKIGKE